MLSAESAWLCREPPWPICRQASRIGRGAANQSSPPSRYPIASNVARNCLGGALAGAGLPARPERACAQAREPWFRTKSRRRSGVDQRATPDCACLDAPCCNVRSRSCAQKKRPGFPGRHLRKTAENYRRQLAARYLSSTVPSTGAGPPVKPAGMVRLPQTQAISPLRLVRAVRPRVEPTILALALLP